MSVTPTRAREGFELHGPVAGIRVLLVDLWRSRELMRILARRDFYVRYRRPSLGVLWAVGLPLVQALVLAVVFSRVVRVETDVSYGAFVVTGMFPWTFFSQVASFAPLSITGGAGMAAKVYFPRAILPIVTVRSAFYSFAPTLVLMVLLVMFFGEPIRLSALLLVPATLQLLALSTALALVLAGLNVYFRDVSFVVRALIQPWFYASAVFYPVDLAPEGILRTLIELNPATGMVHLFRTALFGSPTTTMMLSSTLGWTAALLVFSLFLYRRYDRVFVDLL